MDKPTIALTGASGYLGQFIVSYLTKKGFSIKALSRDIKKSSQLFPNIQWIEGELSSTADYSELLNDCEGLIHGAFHHIKGRYRGGEGDDLEGFLDKNLHGSLNLLKQASKLSYGVFISSRAIYGSSPQTKESDLPAPDSHYGTYKLQIEQAIIKNKWPFATIRPTGVYGLISPIEHSKWYGLIYSLKHHQPYPPAHNGTEVHGDDLAAAIYLLLNPQYCGEIFNCSDFHMSHSKIIQILCDIYHLSAPSPHLSSRLVHPMNCDKLKNIGWQPSGEEKLRETLKNLYKNI
ncbi:MAG: NAD-dependent epimerase/dehydratase family protein [Alphaproteobacteria bacterium]